MSGTPLLALAVAAALLAPAFADRRRRAYAVAFVAVLALFFGLTALPASLPGERLIGNRWNRGGGLLAAAGMLAPGAALVRRAGFARREFGLTRSQRPGSLRAAALVILPVLAVNDAAMTLSRFRLPGVPLEPRLYQASLPGLEEEIAFRGVLLALTERAFAGRRMIGGAPLGWGGMVVAASFVAAHHLSLGALIGVPPAALLHLWLRAHRQPRAADRRPQCVERERLCGAPLIEGRHSQRGRAELLSVFSVSSVMEPSTCEAGDSPPSGPRTPGRRSHSALCFGGERPFPNHEPCPDSSNRFPSAI